MQFSVRTQIHFETSRICERARVLFGMNLVPDFRRTILAGLAPRIAALRWVRPVYRTHCRTSCVEWLDSRPTVSANPEPHPRHPRNGLAMRGRSLSPNESAATLQGAHGHFHKSAIARKLLDEAVQASKSLGGFFVRIASWRSSFDARTSNDMSGGCIPQLIRRSSFCSSNCSWKNQKAARSKLGRCGGTSLGLYLHSAFVREGRDVHKAPFGV